MGAVQSAAHAAVSSTVSMFEACLGNKSGGRRRTLVNLTDMGVDIYEPAGVSVAHFSTASLPYESLVVFSQTTLLARAVMQYARHDYPSEHHLLCRF